MERKMQMQTLTVSEGTKPYWPARVRYSSYRPKAHLLVVDDDPLFCRLMEKIGEESGVLVTTCHSSQELEALALPEVFDAAIVDYYLDGLQMTGPSVAKVLKTTPIVLTSGRPDSTNESEAWPRNIFDFAPKSLGPWNILQAALKLKPTVH